MSAHAQDAAYSGLVALIEARCGLGPTVLHDRLRGFLDDQARVRPCTLTVAGEEDLDWRALVEALLVHETYFYRHPDQLAVLVAEILPRLQLARAPHAGPLRVWCAGCATGEEAYTLAFLLRDAHCPAQILATDLSAESVAFARAGSYRRGPGLNSFRAMPATAWRHFEPVAGVADSWSVAPPVQQTVEFAVHNLMTPHPPGYAADLIACRNVLLYFSDAGLRRAEETLVAASRPGTVLLLGPAERLRYTDVFVPMTPASTQILHWPHAGPG